MLQIPALALVREPAASIADCELTHLASVPIDPGRAANTLTLSGVTLVSASYPRTEQKLHAAGIRTQLIDVSELEKAESGLTCMGLVISAS